VNRQLKIAVKKYSTFLDSPIDENVTMKRGSKLQGKMAELEHVILSLVIREYEASE